MASSELEPVDSGATSLPPTEASEDEARSADTGGKAATKKAEELTRRKKASRQEVDSDSDQVPDGDALPGVGAFRSIGTIAPFLALASTYASAFYSRRKSQESRLDQFAKDHKWLLRGAYLADFTLRVILVGLILLVVARGVALGGVIDEVRYIFGDERP